MVFCWGFCGCKWWGEAIAASPQKDAPGFPALLARPMWPSPLRQGPYRANEQRPAMVRGGLRLCCQDFQFFPKRVGNIAPAVGTMLCWECRTKNPKRIMRGISGAPFNRSNPIRIDNGRRSLPTRLDAEVATVVQADDGGCAFAGNVDLPAQAFEVAYPDRGAHAETFPASMRGLIAPWIAVTSSGVFAQA